MNTNSNEAGRKRETKQCSVQCDVQSLENRMKMFAIKYTLHKRLSSWMHKTRETIKTREHVLGDPALAQALFSKATQVRT